jgi:hypothetical protein
MLAMTCFAKLRCLWRPAMVWLLAAALSAAAIGIAVAEDSHAPPGGAAAQQPPAMPAPAEYTAPSPALPLQPPVANKPGFLHELGGWWDQSIAGFNAKVQDARSKFWDLNQKSTDAVKGAATATQEAVKSTTEATKGAASVILRLPGTRVIETRERCELAPNGAPDCQAAAAAACRGKGFSSGKPLDVRSAENCPTATLLSGQKPAEGACPVETVVSRALCQ